MKEEDLKSNDIIQQQQQAVEEMFTIRYITPQNAVFKGTEGGFVAMTYEGKEYPRVMPYRAFPFTDPDKYISIRDGIGNDSKEIGIIKDLNQMPKETVELLKRQLDIRYFMPVIKKINDIKEEYGYSYWNVLTDRGECRFTVPLGTGNVIRLSENRLIVADIDGNRFEVPDISALSPVELKKLDLYI